MTSIRRGEQTASRRGRRFVRPRLRRRSGSPSKSFIDEGDGWSELVSLALGTTNAGAWQWQPGKLDGHLTVHCCDLYGFDRDKGNASVEEWLERVHPDDRPRLLEALERSLRAGSPNAVRVEFRINHPVRGERWLASAWRLVPSRDGSPRLAGLDIDITAHKSAEARLAGAGQLIDQIIEAAPIGVGVWDESFRFVRVNRRLAEINGLSPAEHIGRRPDEILPQIEGINELYRRWRQILETGEPWLGVEISGATPANPSQLRHWVESFFPIRLGDRIAGIGAIVEDVTEKKRAEKALRESEERFRALVGLSTDWYWEQDETLRFVSFSDSVTRHAGSPPSSHVGLTRWELPHVGVSEEEWAAHRAVLERREPFRDFEFCRINAAGERVWMSVSGDPMFDDSGRFTGYRGTGRNINERKMTELALKQSEERLRLALEASGGGAWVWDQSDGRVSVTDGYRRLYGLKPGEDLDAETWLDLIHPEDRARMRREMEETLRSRTRFQQEFRIIHETRGLRWITGQGRVERDAGGNPVRFFGVDMDITRRKRTEEALERAKQELEQRVAERTERLRQEMQQREAAQAALAQSQRLEATGRLAGGLAHDFNNALAAISANLEIAMMHSPSERSKTAIARALDAVAMSASLNRRLLSFSRRERLAPEVVDLNECLGMVASLLERTIGPAIQLETHAPGSIWPVRVDRGELDTALLNLALNARDAMPDGGDLTISTANMPASDMLARRVPEQAGAGAGPAVGDFVMIRVEDTGCGMSAEVLEKATEPFFTTKERASNSGLGLSSVAEFVRRSGGFLTIESAPGQGTCISMYLPRTVPDEGSAASSEAALQLGDGEVVLVVDDDARVLEATQYLVEGLGYAVVCASSAPEALAMIEEGEPVDIVLSDIVMPGGMTGFDLARRLSVQHPAIRIVLASGHYDAEKAEETGPKPLTILRKPYSRQQLAQALHAALPAAPATENTGR